MDARNAAHVWPRDVDQFKGVDFNKADGPMRFNRKDSAEFSAVELAVLGALGVDRFDFQRTGERETVVPARVPEQQRREAADRKRLAAAWGPF